MFWVAAGLFVLGVACGAAIRLMMFIGVLLGAAVIAAAATATQGIGQALLAALGAVAVLQIGYVAGFVLRAVGRSLFPAASAAAPGKRPISTRFGEKRR